MVCRNNVQKTCFSLNIQQRVLAIRIIRVLKICWRPRRFFSTNIPKPERKQMETVHRMGDRTDMMKRILSVLLDKHVCSCLICMCSHLNMFELTGLFPNIEKARIRPSGQEWQYSWRFIERGLKGKASKARFDGVFPVLGLLFWWPFRDISVSNGRDWPHRRFLRPCCSAAGPFLGIWRTWCSLTALPGLARMNGGTQSYWSCPACLLATNSKLSMAFRNKGKALRCKQRFHWLLLIIYI